MRATNGQILIAGIGNIFLGDDAFGVEVARQLAKRALPENVQIADYGIRCYDLAFALMQDWELVILVDSVSRGTQPGTVYTIEPELSADEEPAKPDANTMTPVSVLQLVRTLGGEPGRVLVVGCEPMKLDADEADTIGLSPPVQNAIALAVRTIEELVSANSVTHTV
jgi:hydrogenase maturation protease